MTNFGSELERQLRDAGMSQQDLARATGITHGQISKWVNGRQIGISEEFLTLIATAVSKDPLIHAALVRSHLEDHRFGPGSGLVRVELNTATGRSPKRAPPTDFERAVEFLVAQAKARKPIRDLLLSQAVALGLPPR